MKKQATILIVDDNEMNRDVLEGLIESLEHKSVSAVSGREALELLGRKSQPDLVLLDILMPEMDGYEVLQFIKNDNNLCAIPVIMISVVDEMESVVKCIKAGAEDYLIKPFNAILLKARINACLEKKRHYDEEQKFNFWLAESYQKLQKAEQTRDALFQMIVHDMNNPLTVVMGELDRLRFRDEAAMQNKSCSSGLKNIDTAARQIHGLVKCILDISEMEQGEIQVSKGTLDAVELVQGIFRQYQHEVSSNGGTLSLVALETKVLCHADKSLLTRIVQNLLVNAIRYGMTNPDPVIGLSVEQAGNTIRICVRDNGPGIPEQYMKKIFSKFFQVDHSKKGLGLGLTFCEMAAKAMGGSLVVENIPVGGCEFCLILAAE